MLFDYVAITEAGKVGDPLPAFSFKEGYTLSYTIGKEILNICHLSYIRLIYNVGTMRTPYVALLDGITMGGVSYYCNYLAEHKSSHTTVHVYTYIHIRIFTHRCTFIHSR